MNTAQEAVDRVNDFAKALGGCAKALSDCLQDFARLVEQAFTEFSQFLEAELQHAYDQLLLSNPWLRDLLESERAQWWKHGGLPPEFQIDRNELDWWESDEPPDFGFAL